MKLTNIIAGLSLLTLTSCFKPHTEYNFSGRIGNEQLEFVVTQSLRHPIYQNTLTVVRNDTTYAYCDSRHNNLKVDFYMTIAPDGKLNPVLIKKADRPTRNRIQLEFDSYRKKILEEKYHK